jgi:hypothetical protein
MYLLGSIAGGDLVDRLKNPYYVISASWVLTGVASLLVQLSTSIFLLAALICVQGIAMGLMSGSSLLCLPSYSELQLLYYYYIAILL